MRQEKDGSIFVCVFFVDEITPHMWRVGNKLRNVKFLGALQLDIGASPALYPPQQSAMLCSFFHRKMSFGAG
jgi:hypothetical protein